MFDIYLGDCKTVICDNSAIKDVDAVVTDPPYGLKFMDKEWDHGVPGVEFWKSIAAAMKPGAHLLAFGGTRTYHRLACAIEDAGFELRDCIMWVYGSGFPKSHNVSKAIDKAAGAEREVVGFSKDGGQSVGSDDPITVPATESARQWGGWGTALKPAYEPIIVARKPLEGTVAQNVLKHGTGAINVDACRVGTDGGTARENKPGAMRRQGSSFECRSWGTTNLAAGRWPANLIHDGSDEVLECLPENARRFFYCAKASKKDRGDGNNHPTVKPMALMEYLIKLVVPPGGTVLDPFMGSGSTLVAAESVGVNSIGIELEASYVEIAKHRLDK